MRLFDQFFPSEVTAFFSDHGTDFSLPLKRPALTAQQKEYLRTRLNFPVESVVHLYQEHRTAVRIVTGNDMAGHRDSFLTGDALVTHTPGIPLAIRTADCLPIFIYDPQKKCCGLVHAGWRGSQKGITEKTMDVLRTHYGSEPRHVFIAFGPAIRECCYQVGEEVKDFFPDETAVRESIFYLDLVRVNRNQLIKWGVQEEHIKDCHICTCCREDFFSYRREGQDCGRHLSLISFRER